MSEKEILIDQIVRIKDSTNDFVILRLINEVVQEMRDELQKSEILQQREGVKILFGTGNKMRV